MLNEAEVGIHRDLRDMVDLIGSGAGAASAVLRNKMQMMAPIKVSLAVAISLAQNYSYASSGDADNTNIKLCELRSSELYCSCVISTSNSLEDNEPILDIFLNGQDEKTVFSMFDKLISSKHYDYHVFLSRKDKSEFVRGKMELFLMEIKRRCGK